MNTFRFKDGNAARRADLMPPDRAPRATRNSAAPRALDVIDAEFEIVPSNSRRAPYPVFNDNHGGKPSMSGRPVAATSDATGFFTWGLARFEILLQAASLKAFAILVTGFCAPVFLLAGGLSHQVPAVTSPPVLSIRGVTTSLNDANGMKILSVYGVVENHSDTQQAVPALLVDVIAGGHKRTASRIVSGETVLRPGESRPFSTRLLHTGGKLPGVAVSFGQTGDSVP